MILIDLLPRSSRDGPCPVSTPSTREPRPSDIFLCRLTNVILKVTSNLNPMLATKLVTSEDPNTQETNEWLEALDGVVEEGGAERAAYLLNRLIDRAALYGAQAPNGFKTPYVNTIPVDEEVPYPGDRA